MGSELPDRHHPVTDFAGRVCDRLSALAARPVWSMGPADLRTALVDLARAEAQLTALRLRVLAEAERVGATDHAASTTADWVAVETRQVRPAAHADLRLAQALEEHPILAESLARGGANTAQARVIVRALDALPTSGEFAVSPQQRQQAEQHLVDLAREHDARVLRILGGRIFEVVAPEVAERLEGRALEAEEAAAARRTTFSMHEDDEGTCHGRFRIPAAHGQMLHKMLLALTSPAGKAVGDDLLSAHPAPVACGLAFCDLLERIPGDTLPRAGGCSATVVVTMTLDQLLTGLGAAGLDTGGQLSASQARRLACNAGIIPVVLGGRGQVLDVGRRRRFHSGAQRIAIATRDRTCTAEGCDRPPGLCHVHHDLPWSSGGPTDIDHARLLCGHHHRRIHDERYVTTRGPTGRICFHRRT